MLNRNSKNRQPCLVSHLRRKAFNFLLLSTMSSVSFSINVLYHVGEVPLYSYFKCFSLERVMNCVEYFVFASIYMIIWLHLLNTERKFNFHPSSSYFTVIICLAFFPFHTMNYLNLRFILDYQYLYLQYLVNCIIHRSHSIILCGNDENEVILQRHMKKKKQGDQELKESFHGKIIIGSKVNIFLGVQ